MEIQNELERKLEEVFEPAVKEVVNESFMHSVPEGSESHFKVVLVSGKFEGMRLVQRHQAVYGALGEIMSRIHALALHTFTPDEWESRGSEAADSPDCKGGSKTG
jgi:BolA protein